MTIDGLTTCCHGFYHIQSMVSTHTVIMTSPLSTLWWFLLKSVSSRWFLLFVITIFVHKLAFKRILYSYNSMFTDNGLIVFNTRAGGVV